MTRKTRITLVGVLGILFITAVSFWALGRDRSTKSNYVTAKVQRTSISNTISATGTLEALRTVQIGSQVSGQISGLFADYNDIVKKGQLLATLDARPAASQVTTSQAHLSASAAAVQSAEADLSNQQANVTQEEANVRIAQVAVDNAKLMYERAQQLDASGLVSKNDFDTAKTNYDSAVAKLQQAKAALDQSQTMIRSRQAAINSAKANVVASRADLERSQLSMDMTKIYSPIDGVVISRSVDIGQTVAASLQAPVLFTIANDLTQMQVKASIDEADIGKLNNDANVRFTVDAFPNDVFKGKINEIRLEPQTVQNVVTYNVIIGVPNPDKKLRPGMTANLTITVDSKTDALVVPNAAFRFTPDATSGQPQGRRANTIWILDENGQPQSKTVRTGIADGSRTEIISDDIEEGTPVITGDLSKKTSNNNSGQRQGGTSFGMPGVGGGGFGGGFGSRGGGR
jgi:HlyD family secretion protein